jgi:hypothetical protein
VKNDRGVQLLCAWSGPASALLAILGMVVIGGFVPPQDPSDSAQEIANFYRDNDTQILIGMVIAMTGFTLFVPFGIGVAIQTRRIEDRPVMTYIQIACVAIAALEGVMAAFIWGAAAFRPGEMDPDITRTLNDLGWFAFLFDIPPFAVWIGAIAIAIFRDRSDPPVFPRWVAYLNLWVALLIWPAELMAFFKTGPFAFNGLLALYLPAGLFFAWLVAMSIVLMGVIKREAPT